MKIVRVFAYTEIEKWLILQIDYDGMYIRACIIFLLIMSQI